MEIPALHCICISHTNSLTVCLGHSSTTEPSFNSLPSESDLDLGMAFYFYLFLPCDNSGIFSPTLNTSGSLINTPDRPGVSGARAERTKCSVCWEATETVIFALDLCLRPLAKIRRELAFLPIPWPVAILRCVRRSILGFAIRVLTSFVRMCS